MTRETKIGLLVGLAFIIVVAILLTDHTTMITDPRPAALGDAGSNVRESVTPPGNPGQAEVPRAPIPTRVDLNPPESVRPPVRIVEVGPGSGPPIAVGNNPPSPTGGYNGSGALPPIEGMPPIKPVKSGRGVIDLVAEHPDELMQGGNGSPGRTPVKPATLPVTPPKTYVAEAGDSVSRIASKTMAGGNSKANREALVKANPSLQTEANTVQIGKTYVIPSAGATAQVAEMPKPNTPPAGAPPVAPGPTFTSPPTVPNTVWYTVKEKDNLWRIADRELGNGNLWSQIRDLNKDVLKGDETVRPQMRIRLPKPNATASTN